MSRQGSQRFGFGNVHEGVTLVNEGILVVADDPTLKRAAHWGRLVAKGIGDETEGFFAAHPLA